MDWNSSLWCLFYSCLWLFMKFTNMSLLITFMTYSYQTIPSNITKSLSSRFMHEISASMAWASPRFTPCSNWMLARHCTTVKTSSRPVHPAQTLQLGEIWVCDGKDMEGHGRTRFHRKHQDRSESSSSKPTLQVHQMHQAICQGIGPGFWH